MIISFSFLFSLLLYQHVLNTSLSLSYSLSLVSHLISAPAHFALMHGARAFAVRVDPTGLGMSGVSEGHSQNSIIIPVLSWLLNHTCHVLDVPFSTSRLVSPLLRHLARDFSSSFPIFSIWPVIFIQLPNLVISLSRFCVFPIAHSTRPPAGQLRARISPRSSPSIRRVRSAAHSFACPSQVAKGAIKQPSHYGLNIARNHFIFHKMKQNNT